MDGPPVDHGPLQPGARLLAHVPVDGVEAGAGGGAGVLGVLRECHCMLHTITAIIWPAGGE